MSIPRLKGGDVMRANIFRLRSTVRSLPFAAAAALVVTGCSSSPFARIGDLNRSQQDARYGAMGGQGQDSGPPTQLVRPDEGDYVGGAAYWGAQVQANPADVEANLNFARNLRMMGGAAQATQVLKNLVMRNPSNVRVLAEYGKALTASERPDEAVGFLTQALQMSPNDWSLLSARGVAFDQSGDHTSARQDYAQALHISEENPAVLTNFALSYVLSGQPAEAEPILRRVVARADATAAMRQNLAMVLAIQGKTVEAAELGRKDLPPAAAIANAELFAQFQAPAPAAPRAAAPVQPKAQISAGADTVSADQDLTAFDGDPMATPIAPRNGQAATGAPLAMTPVADDVIVAPAKPRPAKNPAPKAAAVAAVVPPAAGAPAPRPAPARAVSAKPATAITTNGDTLITTINGIPVIGEAKPKKPAADAAGALRRGSL